MRVFAEVGIADAFLEKVRLNPGMQFVDLDGNMLLDWPRPQDVTPLGWNASYRFHQPDLERLLRKSLESHETSDIRNGVKVVGIAQTPDGVVLTAEDADGSPPEEFAARYVVGCDGAGSTVRRSIGQGMEDLGFREKWLVVDVILKREVEGLGDHTVQFCDNVTPMTYCRGPGNRRRWEMRAPLDAEDDTLTEPDYVWSLLSRWITPDDADLERSAVYVFGSAIAEKWRSGRLLIAGDAAHLTPPFMGQGMCAGIRDAVNLAWKLDHALRTDDKVLDSYQSERRPHVRAYVEMAIKLGSLINSLDREGAITHASENSGESASMRSITPPLGDGLRAGTLEGGTVFTNPVFSDGQTMDKTANGRWVLLQSGPVSKSSDRVLRRSGQNEPAVASLLNELEANTVLVRPDGYLLGLAKTENELAEMTSFLKQFDV